MDTKVVDITVEQLARIVTGLAIGSLLGTLFFAGLAWAWMKWRWR
jgi:hypothetical protein